MPEPRSRWEWDPKLGYTGRYRDRTTGRIVSRATITTELDKRLDVSRQMVRSLSKDLANGSISLSKWQSEMTNVLRATYTYSGALAKGGWNNMTNQDWLVVARASKDNYWYLQRMATQIQSGQLRLVTLDGSINPWFLRRADLYAQAGYNVFDLVSMDQARQNQAKYTRTVTNPRAENCTECLDEEHKGWVPIGESKPIGARLCGRNCRCTRQFSSTKPPNASVAATLNPVVAPIQ